MTGAEDRHVTVTGNLYIALRQHRSGGPCRTPRATIDDMVIPLAPLLLT